jgi:type I restriction enzyme S subunit
MILWCDYNLKETIVSANTGLDAIKRAPIVEKYTGIKCLRIQDVSQKKDFESWGNTEVSDVNYGKFKLLKNDIIIARTGATVGVNLIIKKDLPSVYNNGLIRLRINDQFDSSFVHYNLKSPKFWEHIYGIAFGTTSQPNIQINQLLGFKLKAPDLLTQKAIAEILSSLDDKIELNSQINQNLEALAQALFKQWFVDFEFPNENGEPYKSSGGEMIDSGLGEIPKGWEVKSLDEIAEYLNGIALQKFRPINETDPFLPVIKIRELRQGYADGEEKASIEIDKKYIILDGDILFSWSGSLLVDFWTGGKGALNQHLFKVTSQTYPKWFIFLWTKFHLLEFQKIAESKATTMGHIQRKHLTDAKVVVPSQKFFQVFSQSLETTTDHIISLRLESKKLTNLRDTLLPRLISGVLVANDIKF